MVTNDFVRVKVSSSGNRQVDFGEVCILDPQVSKKILQVYVDKDYSGVLRLLTVTCNFQTIKRLFVSVNTTWDLIATDSQGSHWILAELYLHTNQGMISSLIC